MTVQSCADAMSRHRKPRRVFQTPPVSAENDPEKVPAIRSLEKRRIDDAANRAAKVVEAEPERDA